ncbi:MAG: YgiW/YdeI family stress tolerance OB fold protein [Proteobacteria bacterium]|uniref:YgiW/YdeI family stress tolerance OB fold protein n=1 Tax=Candidatus Enterousia avistercoris TaxID=2840788 RepID=A0A9D9DEY1_9PROT|nr:YgiW/YdeI family stress tolerance OB fold protein [Candidatus Enterousia avistercoris]
MKKISVMAMVCAVVAGAAHADFQPNKPQPTSPMGGFVGGAENVVTVSQVKEMRDDTPVIVQGNIVQRMGDEDYLFEDSTGSITVEIDRKDWRGQTVSPSDTVKLYGEVDSGLFKTEIDVDYVEKM